MRFSLKTTSTTGLHRRSPDIGTTLLCPHSVLDAILRLHFRLRQTLESIRSGAGCLDVIPRFDSGAVPHAQSLRHTTTRVSCPETARSSANGSPIPPPRPRSPVRSHIAILTSFTLVDRRSSVGGTAGEYRPSPIASLARNRTLGEPSRRSGVYPILCK